ncbi:hypothetical protein N656DRAFT_777526 [Canariomyces notabilis]|uniref:Uncharacterized protein n=1 Tax=Canariomyces notabilis TaxID=2074819 RepID=A0AAN6TH50_9PEZI|nr:hypothetical protein N656DRAFT_777526 [Canariomyces arenarius]
MASSGVKYGRVFLSPDAQGVLTSFLHGTFRAYFGVAFASFIIKYHQFLTLSKQGQRLRFEEMTPGGILPMSIGHVNGSVVEKLRLHGKRRGIFKMLRRIPSAL